MEREIIEIAPPRLHAWIGPDDAFVILDEAQNTTIMQIEDVLDSFRL